MQSKRDLYEVTVFIFIITVSLVGLYKSKSQASISVAWEFIDEVNRILAKWEFIGIGFPICADEYVG